jgi:ABC-type branched-subunit amino acid transport system substrate-binding protein
MMWTRRAALQGIGALGGLGTLGAALAAPAEGDWVVGQVGPFTGIPVPDAPQLGDGIKAAFGQINARGGIGGRRVSFFQLDDTYTPDGFVKAFREAMGQRPAALLSPVGSASIKRLLDDKLLDQHDVVVINAIPGAEALRNPGHPRLFHVRAGDRAQIEKLLQNAAAVGITRLGVLYQPIPIGTSGLAMAQELAGPQKVTLQPVEAANEPAAIQAGVARLAELQPQGFLLLGAPRYMADAVVALRKAGLSRFVFALGYLPAGLLNDVAGDGARGVAMAQTYPNPSGVGGGLQRDFQAAMQAHAPQVKVYTSFHLEGYVSARVFAEAARRTREPGADALARSLHAMGEVDLGGFRLDFSRGQVGSRFVDVGVMGGSGKLVY